MRSATAAAALVWAAALPVQAAVFFENLPTGLVISDQTESHHGVGGPIIADDFVSAFSGQITRVEWWGSEAADSHWELAFHTDDPTLHQPNIDSAFQGAMVKYGAAGDLLATGVADVPGDPGIFHYTVDLPFSLGVTAGTEYWFTVANFTGGWHWANALAGPTVGSENFGAHQSTGVGPCQDGGPHCGPWTDLNTDFAFRINGIPEPTTLLLVGLGLGAIVLSRKGRSVDGDASELSPDNA
ncbi:PEP-CTERM sorting domain-containing protein [Aquabacterium sp.]|uniref:PEP-CTERM sorting domain-containing protein n=1 Tax=Aquabacterium sp. TaxID=1872578 RepID=UPI003783AEA2